MYLNLNKSEVFLKVNYILIRISQHYFKSINENLVSIKMKISFFVKRYDEKRKNQNLN